MTGSRISNTVTSTVVLGGNLDPSPLTITATGVIDVTQPYGAAGITGAQAGDELINRGSVTAALGSSATNLGIAGAGGVGIDLTASGTIVSTGIVAGGAGGYAGSNNYSGAGGNGIDAAGGKIVNSGMIEGGDIGGTGLRGTNAQSGGIGVYASGAGLALSNSGTIAGGFSFGAGGAGVDFAAAGTLRNTGSILGGLTQGGIAGGVGVDLASGSVLVNRGEITGGFAASGVVAEATILHNDGTITGGYGFTVYANHKYIDNAGAAGVSLTGGVLTNTGVIAGGAGTYPFGPNTASAGGAGVLDTGGAVLNYGTIEGGATQGDFVGSEGVYLAAGASLSNHGTVMGGAGEYNRVGVSYGGSGLDVAASANAFNAGLIQGGSGIYSGGGGGAGVVLEAGATLTNAGTIAGGAGGTPIGYNGGFGGAGVFVSSGATLTNSGTIIGGAGPAPNGSIGAAGGVGVEIQGSTFTNSGTIIGGADTLGGSMGNAVYFATYAGTLVVQPGAVFEGDIASKLTLNNTLELAGTLHGTLSGFGTSITGISTIIDDSHAHWNLQGYIHGQGPIVLDTGAYLALTDGTVSIASIVFGAGGGETLYFGAPASVSSTLSGFSAGDRIDLANTQASSLSYANGTLTLLGANNVIVDTVQFAGNNTAADFALQREGQTTEIIYVGSNASSPAPDFALETSLHAPPAPFVDEPMRVALPRSEGLALLAPWLHR